MIVLSPVSLFPSSVTLRQSLLFLQPPLIFVFLHFSPVTSTSIARFISPYLSLSAQLDRPIHSSLTFSLPLDICPLCSTLINALPPLLSTFCSFFQNSLSTSLHFNPSWWSIRFSGHILTVLRASFSVSTATQTILQPAGTESPAGQFVLWIVNGNLTQNASGSVLFSIGFN